MTVTREWISSYIENRQNSQRWGMLPSIILKRNRGNIQQYHENNLEWEQQQSGVGTTTLEASFYYIRAKPW